MKQITSLLPAMLALAIAAPVAMAEIVEIPPEEMTEAYIKDTTVIVKKQIPVAEQAPRAVIKVSPIEDDYSEGETAMESTTVVRTIQEGTTYDMIPQQNYQLDAQTSYTFESPAYDPYLHANDAKLREVLGLEPGTPIDYNNLQFPVGVNTDGSSTASADPTQFQLVIPNSGNYAPGSFGTPNGEIGVNVTQDAITLQLNLPQR